MSFLYHLRFWWIGIPNTMPTIPVLAQLSLWVDSEKCLLLGETAPASKLSLQMGWEANG